MSLGRVCKRDHALRICTCVWCRVRRLKRVIRIFENSFFSSLPLPASIDSRRCTPRDTTCTSYTRTWRRCTFRRRHSEDCRADFDTALSNSRRTNGRIRTHARARAHTHTHTHTRARARTSSRERACEPEKISSCNFGRATKLTWCLGCSIYPVNVI